MGNTASADDKPKRVATKDLQCHTYIKTYREVSKLLRFLGGAAKRKQVQVLIPDVAASSLSDDVLNHS